MSERTKTVQIILNGTPYEVPEGANILDACRDAEIEVPVFCSHKRLSVAGNCRMCLVDVEGMPKLAASCAMPVCEGMVVSTESERVQKARKGNLELMLINHPLDCPVCDLGGECDLQDITLAYGPSTSRFMDNKRAVADKYMGPLIKTVMTRCIHCTRCVRFATEAAGVEELGATGRGETMEITTYLENAMRSPLSGNVIDLCPVGALNAKPSSCKGRSWELTHIPSIDVSDALGSHVTYHMKDQEIMRVMPRENAALNEEWLTDKARFSYDGLTRQRLDTPYIRKNGKLTRATWMEALLLVSKKMKQCQPQEMAALAGDLVDVETSFALRQLLDTLGVESRDCREFRSALPAASSVKHRSDYFLIIREGFGKRMSVCWWARIQRWNPPHELAVAPGYTEGLPRGSCGAAVDLGCLCAHLSQKGTVLNKFGVKHAFSDLLKNAKNPVIILGTGALQDLDGEATYQTARFIADQYGVVGEDWNGFNVLQTAAGRVGALDAGFFPVKKGDDADRILRSAEGGHLRFLYLLGREDVRRQDIGNAFVVYQGHHGDHGAQMADVILPGLTHTEKQALYVNMEGRVQETAIVTEVPGEAKEDWKIIWALSEMLKQTLPYDTRESLLEALCAENKIFETRGALVKSAWKKTAQPKEIRRGILEHPITNYYMTDVVGRASSIMASCVQEILRAKA